MDNNLKFEHLNNLFLQLEPITEMIKTRIDNDNKFNIFSILHKIRDERCLHSRFIAAMLNPKGSHGLGSKPLEAFLEIVGLDDFDAEGAIVIPNENHKGEKYYIDIQIVNSRSTPKKAIIIENKIDAGDSNKNGGQLETYFVRMSKKEDITEDNLYVYYLTPNRRSPSKESIGSNEKLREKCKNISYPHEILVWIDRLIIISDNNEFLKNVLLQYKKIINMITGNDTTIQEQKKIYDVIGYSKANLDSLILVLRNKKNIVKLAIKYFWEELKAGLEKEEFRIISEPEEYDISSMVEGKKNPKGCRLKFEAKNGLIIRIKQDEGCPMFFGVAEKGTDKDAWNERIKCYNRKHANDYINDGFLISKKFTDITDAAGSKEKPRPSNIRLDDMLGTSSSSYLLINKDFRLKVINQMIKDVVYFVNELNN